MLIFKKVSSDVIKCPKDWFSVRETCRENKDMVCRGRAKKPARAQREDYAEQRELEVPVFSWGGVFFHKTLPGLPIYPVLPAGFIRDIKEALLFFINDTVMRRVGRSESL